MGPNDIAPVFVGVWIVLGVTSGLFFHLSKNAELKRRVWPPLVIGSSLLFLGFTIIMFREAPSNAWLFVIPAVAVITFLNFRNTRFCDACGKTIYNSGFFSRSKFCPKCGAKLK
jgi:hypothetical protein